MRRFEGRLRVTRNQWPTILVQWLAAIQIDAGKLELTLVDAAADVVETLHTRRPGLRGALRRLGNVTGDLGWPLEQVNVWNTQLHALTSHSHRVALRSVESITAVAEGWAERYVRGVKSGAGVDAVTGLGTHLVLRLRLREIYEQCRAFDITPTDAYCFVIVDADTDDLAPFERDAVMVTTAGVVGEVFHQGETVIRNRNRVIVLAAKSESTRERFNALGDTLQAAPVTRSGNPVVWTDELPASGLDIDRHLRDLVG